MARFAYPTTFKFFCSSIPFPNDLFLSVPHRLFLRLHERCDKEQKNTMKKHLILCLILLSVNILLAQNVQVDTNATYVIANGGLNLRSKPSVNAKKIANIPFGSTIKYISGKSFKNDSILVRHTDNKEKELIIGNWVRVEYKKMKGYVLDIYLNYKPDLIERFDERFDNDFILLYPGCGCNTENIHNPRDWRWFGYFKDGEGKYNVKEVDISYYRTRIYTCDLIISASKNDSLSFIIGSKIENLSKEKVVRGKKARLYSYEKSNPVKKSDLDNASVELIENKDVKIWKPSELYLINGDKRQLLNKPEYNDPVEIEFMGDLDGDLKDDYIIRFGDKTGIVILYLTSKAKSGNLIEKVAIFFASYCC